MLIKYSNQNLICEFVLDLNSTYEQNYPGGKIPTEGKQWSWYSGVEDLLPGGQHSSRQWRTCELSRNPPTPAADPR